MKYDFDKVIDRHHTYSTQWDYIGDRFQHEDILPFSISDTDFIVPEPVQQALQERMKHPIYGYSRWNHANYKNSIVDWYQKRHQAFIESDWIIYSPSVIFSIATLMRLNSEEGDSVAVFIPMYDAFFQVIQANNRMVVPVLLQGSGKKVNFDVDQLETILKQDRTKIFLLTNPHNPTGKVFTEKELMIIVKLCSQYGVFIISDDIHSDIVYQPAKYLPLTEITDQNIAICTSSSKTFNTPGLMGSYTIIPDAKLRERFLVTLKQQNGLSSVSIFGMLAQMAGYNEADDYVDQLVTYLQTNMLTIQQFISNHQLPLIFEPPEATYLAWIDISKIPMEKERFLERLETIGKVGIMAGTTYGNRHFLRMNIGCSHLKLERGLVGIAKALNE